MGIRNIEHTPELYNQVGQFCRLLNEGKTLDETIGFLGLSPQGFLDLYEIYSSNEYRRYLSQSRENGLNHVPEMSDFSDYECEMRWRKLVDPLTLLEDCDIEGLHMFVQEYVHDGITKRKYHLCNPYKTFTHSSGKNIELIDPREGYARYLSDKERGLPVSLEADPYLIFKGNWLLRESYSLTSIRGHKIGVKGKIYVETRFPDETGDRKFPYLYYTYENEVAELTVELKPQLVIGPISDEELEKLQRWIVINLDSLQRHWDAETGSLELIEELLDLNGKHIYLPK